MTDPTSQPETRVPPRITEASVPDHAVVRGPAALSNPTQANEPAADKDPIPQGPTIAVGGAKGPAIPPLTVPGYTVLGVLGHGGMGVVYRARETALDRLVALKVVTAGSHASPEQLARFRAEARAEARLQHPHIVQVHAVGEHEGLPFLSLEYMDGGNLAQKVAHQPQPPREAAQLIFVLARAIGYAHQRGVIHRDLKPANILLKVAAATTEETRNTRTEHSSTRPGRSGSLDSSSALLADFQLGSLIPKVADFGLAKCLEDDSSQTRTGTLMGTPDYMSPEQAEGRKDIERPTDIWSLGIILYELLVGRTPFQGVTTVETLEQVRTREPVPPTHLQPHVPTDLETICLKCLRKEVAQRYATAEDLADDLGRFLNGEPIRARPVGAIERTVRWCRRNPRIATLGSAVGLLLLAIFVVSVAFAFVLDQRRRELEEAWRQSEHNAEIARAEEVRATASAHEASERSQLLRDALTVVIDRVQQDFRPFPETREVRRKILQQTMRVLQQSLAREHDSTRQPERSLAAAYMLMGDLLVDAKDFKGAREQFVRCHDILKALYLGDPENDKASGNYAAALSRLGDMAGDLDHDPARALKLYQQALVLQEHSLDHRPEHPELTRTEIRRSIAGSHRRIGEILLHSQPPRLIEARLHLITARNSLDQVLAVDDSAGNHLSMETVCKQLGELEERLGHWKEARAALERCLQARRNLLRTNPANLDWAAQIARLCGRIGDMYLFEQDTATAQRYYEEAVTSTERLAARDSQLGLRVLLSLNYYRRATAWLRQGENDRADDDYQRCLDLRQDLVERLPNHEGLKIDLMVAQARCGHHRQAAASAQGLCDRYPKNGEYLLHAACGFSLCAFALSPDKDAAHLTAASVRLRQEYCDKAVAALRQAIANGYHDLRNLQVEPDLDPIRGEKGFQRLVTEMAGKQRKP